MPLTIRPLPLTIITLPLTILPKDSSLLQSIWPIAKQCHKQYCWKLFLAVPLAVPVFFRGDLRVFMMGLCGLSCSKYLGRGLSRLLEFLELLRGEARLQPASRVFLTFLRSLLRPMKQSNSMFSARTSRFLRLFSCPGWLVVTIFSVLTFTLQEVLTLMRLFLATGDRRCAVGDLGMGEVFSERSSLASSVIDFMCLDLLLDLFLRPFFLGSFLMVSSSFESSSLRPPMASLEVRQSPSSFSNLETVSSWSSELLKELLVVILRREVCCGVGKMSSSNLAASLSLGSLGAGSSARSLPQWLAQLLSTCFMQRISKGMQVAARIMESRWQISLSRIQALARSPSRRPARFPAISRNSVEIVKYPSAISSTFSSTLLLEWDFTSRSWNSRQVMGLICMALPMEQFLNSSSSTQLRSGRSLFSFCIRHWRRQCRAAWSTVSQWLTLSASLTRPPSSMSRSLYSNSDFFSQVSFFMEAASSASSRKSPFMISMDLRPAISAPEWLSVCEFTAQNCRQYRARKVLRSRLSAMMLSSLRRLRSSEWGSCLKGSLRGGGSVFMKELKLKTRASRYWEHLSSSHTFWQQQAMLWRTLMMMYLSMVLPQLAAYSRIFSASLRQTRASLARSMLILSLALLLSSITRSRNSSTSHYPYLSA